MTSLPADDFPVRVSEVYDWDDEATPEEPRTEPPVSLSPSTKFILGFTGLILVLLISLALFYLLIVAPILA